MTHLKNTPGPWKMRPGLEKSWENVEITGGPEDEYVLTGIADNDADIRLIAAAPELLEALQAMLEVHGVTKAYAEKHIEIPQIWVEVSDLARAAIAKATGQS